MKITVAGSGAFGTGLAIALSGTGSIQLLGRDPEVMAQIQTSRENTQRLPDATLPPSITATADSDVLADTDVVLLCIPTQQLTGYLQKHAKELANKPLLACCKGIDLSTLKGPADVIAAQIPSAKAGVLTGPSFAADIAKGLPTALTLATTDESIAEYLQQALTRPAVRVYRSSDVIGAQLGGALKNVVAIAAGTTIGAGLGESARAALITRGFAEMQKLAEELGARPETLMGLSGIGDLILTCSSEQSRNYSYGLTLGRGQNFDPSITVEGATTAQAVARLAAESGLDLPVARAVDDLVSGRGSVANALLSLLSRPLREE